MSRYLLLLIPMACLAQIQRPPLGLVLDENAALRPAYGIPASAILGDPVAEGVTSFACTQFRCFAKSGASIASFAPASPDINISAQLSDGPAIIAPNTDTAVLYFPGTGQAARWRINTVTEDGSVPPLEFFDFSPAGEVLAIRATRESGGFDYVVRRDDGVWIEHFSIDDGSTASVGNIDYTNDEVGSPKTIRAALLLGDGYAIATDSGIARIRSDGTRRDFAISGVSAFHPMSADYVEAVTDNGRWVLCVANGNESANLLPGVSR